MRRPVSGFSIAFIDIMCCGLGALVFLFILIKEAPNGSENSPTDSDLLEEITELEEKKRSLTSRGQEILNQETSQKNRTNEIAKEIQLLDQQIARNERELKSIQKRIEAKSRIADSVSNKVKTDKVKLSGTGEEEYLIGLKVEGKKIAILLDTSSSMTNEKLIDILKTKSSSNRAKVSATKWRRTQRIVLWLLARLPKSSQYQVISYNDKAKVLQPGFWSSAADSAALRMTQLELNKLIPFGPTNFEKALRVAAKQKPTDIYVITDGLPTQGEMNEKLLGSISGCNSFYKNKNIISGQCRVELFSHAVRKHSFPGTRINVILLPLEGDPIAAPAYVDWARSTRGMLISPAGTWP
mgnify:FL=1